MAGMPPVMGVKLKKPPPVGPDDKTTTRVAGANGVSPHLPDRDGPAKRKMPTPSKKTSEPAKKKAPDYKGMRGSLKGLI